MKAMISLRRQPPGGRYEVAQVRNISVIVRARRRAPGGRATGEAPDHRGRHEAAEGVLDLRFLRAFVAEPDETREIRDRHGHAMDKSGSSRRHGSKRVQVETEHGRDRRNLDQRAEERTSQPGGRR